MSCETTVDYAIQELGRVFEKHPVDAGHGLSHGLDVMNATQEALKHYRYGHLDDCIVLSILLAALLHDADDHKFFPQSKDYDNAKAILRAYAPIVQVLAMKMIKLVSCSVNGNTMTDVELPKEEWMLYSRWVDRLFALGRKGIYRCWVYSRTVNRPDYTDETVRVTNMDELEKVAPASRFAHYIEMKGNVGESTMIDHFYDKLVHLCVKTENPYLNERFEKEMAPIYDFLFDFGRTGFIDKLYIEELKAEFAPSS